MALRPLCAGVSSRTQADQFTYSGVSMGSLTVYIGPFARVPGVSKQGREMVRQCSAGCGAVPARDAKFCSACGAQIAATATKVGGIVRLESSMLPDDFVSRLMCPQYCSGAHELEAIVLPNTRREGLRMNDSGAQATSLVDVDFPAELTKFGERYGDLLHYIETTYGVTVVLDWGAVGYAY